MSKLSTKMLTLIGKEAAKISFLNEPGYNTILYVELYLVLTHFRTYSTDDRYCSELYRDIVRLPKKGPFCYDNHYCERILFLIIILHMK